MASSAALLAIASVAITGCTPTRQIVATGGALHEKLGTLRRVGTAQVETTSVEGDRTAPGSEVVGYDQEIVVDGKLRSIADLGYRCGDVPPPRDAVIPDDNQCQLLARRDDSFVLRSYRGHASLATIGGIALGVVVVGGFIATIACASECNDPYQTISIVALATLVGTAVVSCIRSTHCLD